MVNIRQCQIIIKNNISIRSSVFIKCYFYYLGHSSKPNVFFLQYSTQTKIVKYVSL